MIKKETYALKICGTDDLLKFIEENLPVKNTNRKLEKRQKGQIISQLSIGGIRQVIVCVEYLYCSATVFLDRKYEKAMQIISEYKKK